MKGRLSVLAFATLAILFCDSAFACGSGLGSRGRFGFGQRRAASVRLIRPLRTFRAARSC